MTDIEFLSQIKYVITLDSDTQLPRDTALKLIGIAMHPLNRPHFEEKLQRVTRGYGILQPRVSISLTSASRSYFPRVFSGNTGIDPYTTASSDVYHDFAAIDPKEREEALELVLSTNPTLTPAISSRWMDNWVRENREVVYRIKPLTVTGRSSVKVKTMAAFVPLGNKRRSQLL